MNKEGHCNNRGLSPLPLDRANIKGMQKILQLLKQLIVKVVPNFLKTSQLALNPGWVTRGNDMFQGEHLLHLGIVPQICQKHRAERA